ncbi:MAG: carboxypeptidase regulatory-like domain-containing protein [Candidatus Muiribacteriota bacterium]
MKKLTLILFTAFLIAFLSGCTSSSSGSFTDEFLNDAEFSSHAGSAVFKGNVTFREIPVENADVRVLNLDGNIRYKTETDEDGIFVIKNEIMGKKLSYARYIIEVHAAGFNTEREQIDLRIDRERNFVFELLGSFSTGSFESAVSGRTIDSYTLNPVEEVEISIENKKNLTTREGEFFIPKNGSEVVNFSKENYKSVVANFDNDGVYANNTVYMNPTLATINGVVVDKHNLKFLDNIVVGLYQDDELISSTRSNENGEYRFSNIYSGNYMLRYEHEDYQNFEKHIQVHEVKEYKISEIEMTGRKSSVSGKVIDINSGKGIANMAVITGDGAQCFTDSNGNYIIPSLTPGFYELSVVAPDFEVQKKKVYIEPNNQVTENFFVKQRNGNSRVNLDFYTKYEDNIKGINFDYVNVTLRKFETYIYTDEENNIEVELRGNKEVTSFIIQSDGDNEATITNLYSGYYEFEAVAFIPVNSAAVDENRPAGYYVTIADSDDPVYIAPGIELSLSAIMEHEGGDTETSETEGEDD